MMSRPKKSEEPKPLSEQLRTIIQSSGKTAYRIGVESGLDTSQISRFMAGTSRFTTESLDKLATALNLEITVRKPSES